MFDNFFIKTAHQKMLSFLSSHAGESFHERELVRRAGIGAGSANRVLNELFEAGILRRETRGKMHFYILDEKEPAVRQFKVLNTVLALTPLVKRLRAVARTAILYGSSSRGTDDYGSDIDLLIVASVREKPRELVESFKFPREIKAIIKSPSEWLELESRDPTFHAEISKGVVLWDKEIDESKL